MFTDPLDDLLTQPEYADIRRCSERTIERERSSGTGCPYVKISRSVRYRRRDILNFIEKHVRHSTSEMAQSAAVPDMERRERPRHREQGREPQRRTTPPAPESSSDEIPL